MSIRKYIISALSALLLPAAAIAQESGPVVDYLYNNANTAYFYISPEGQLEKFTLDIYSDVRRFSHVATVDLLSEDLAIHAVSGLENVYALPVTTEAGDVVVYQTKYKFVGGQEVTSPLYDGNDPFVYMTDLTRGPISVGWHIPYYDIAYNGTEPLRTLRSTYAKGYGVHAGGYVETHTSVNLSQFSRFCADVGGQIISNPTRGKLGFRLYNGVDQPFVNTGNVTWQTVTSIDFTLENTAPGKTLKLQFTDGGDGNTNDIVCIGAPRFYYNEDAGTKKEPQTIHFDTPGGTIFDEAPEVTLSAYASGGTHIFYSIVKGADIATIEGNVLRPKDGYSGEIVVEAMTLGDRKYAPASATQTYNFRFGPVIEYLYTHKNTEDNSGQTMYIYVDRRGKELEKLTVDIYDNVRGFNKIKSVDFVTEGLDKYAVSNLKNVYAIPLTVPEGTTTVYQMVYKFAGEDEVAGKLCEGKEPFVYLTDITPASTVRVGWHIPFYDKAYNGTEPLRNSRHTYGKGYGVHAGGFVETSTALDLSQFTRFSVDVGGQVISNPTRGRLGFALYNGVSQPYLNSGNVSWDKVYEWDFPLQSTAAGKTVKLAFTDGGDGNTNDIVCIGAPRFYYSFETRLPQTIEWVDEEIINNYQAFTMPLTATASSGLPVIYRVVSGSEYARIDNNSNLTFFNIPSEGVVVVEAYQPGSKDYEPTEVSYCSFRIRRAMIIRENERKELIGGHDIDELIVYGNAGSVGQAVVKDGIVNVKKLLLKYTFVPGEWNYISFPSDLDLEKVSDLMEKGFACASEEGINHTYILREYDGRKRAENPTESPWTSITSGKVSAMKGYIMKLESSDDTPVEITFNIDNVALDFDNSICSMNLAVDMSKCEPETRHTVYIRPSNVKGNTLRVDMRYVPASREDLPLNHARALEAMRVTRSQDGSYIRLTLPEQTPARVAFFDGKDEKMVKAVNYVSPMKIDVSDLKHGKYRMIVIYGPASIEKEIEL
ncbi:MAG: NPCBM/NEW2 domain-containing protein [Muribaculaceae bacterium]|nr:NPCBM/NEW2 domain-containing protein [Muribaculaceae bacterium]